MSRWLRLYDDTINDPKILKLPEAMRWHWIALLCVASKNGGALPALDDVAIQLRLSAAKATEIIATLVKAGLLDKMETGFAPHNWSGRQYKSDVSTERVKRFRNGGKSVSQTVSETPPETEAETEQNIDKPVAKATRPASDAFERFKAAFPRRDGANPWQPAEKKFNALVKTGVDPEVMIAAAAALTRDEASRGNVGTKFIPQAITWLNQQRFVDYAVYAATAPDDAIDWDTVCRNYLKFNTWAVRHYGAEPGEPGCKCPSDVLLKHGITSDARTAKEVQRLISGAM